MYNIIDIIAMDGNYSYNKVIDKGYNIYVYIYIYICRIDRYYNSKHIK